MNKLAYNKFQKLTCVHSCWPNVMVYGNTLLLHKLCKVPQALDANPATGALYPFWKKRSYFKIIICIIFRNPQTNKTAREKFSKEGKRLKVLDLGRAGKKKNFL